MGESVRADHLPLNGYHRNTMPRLSRESNIVSFPHATSFGIVTRISAIGMFTDAELCRRTPVTPPSLTCSTNTGSAPSVSWT